MNPMERDPSFYITHSFKIHWPLGNSFSLCCFLTLVEMGKLGLGPVKAQMRGVCSALLLARAITVTQVFS